MGPTVLTRGALRMATTIDGHFSQNAAGVDAVISAGALAMTVATVGKLDRQCVRVFRCAVVRAKLIVARAAVVRVRLKGGSWIRNQHFPCRFFIVGWAWYFYTAHGKQDGHRGR